MSGNWSAWEDEARQRDRDDPLACWRDRFALPPAPAGGDAVYLCGNSLGLMPAAAETAVRQVLADWGRHGVEGHFKAEPSWYAYHEALAPAAAALVGAEPDEVVVMNTLTVNLHLLMISFFRPRGERCRIAIEAGAFPSDRYAVESQLRLHGLDPDTDLVLLRPRRGEATLRGEDIETAVRAESGRLALLLLGGVQYLTGQRFDLARVTAAARAAGSTVGIDLAHAVGNVPLALHDDGVDFAVWCSYKYLNGGPGAPAGCFVHRRHGCGEGMPRLEGWWGTDPATRFRMDEHFMPQPGAAAWQLSNPPILAMAALKGSLDIFQEVGMPALRDKSVALTGFLERLLAGLDPPVPILTPADPGARGCQLSLRVGAGAGELARAMAARGVIVDAREPDVLRLAPVPLYNRFTDVLAAVRALAGLRPGI